jgi:hypothetical protein
MVTLRQRQNLGAPKRLLNVNIDEVVARKLQKAEEVADWLADVAAIKAANDAHAFEDEYQRRMEAWNHDVVAAAAPVVAAAAPVVAAAAPVVADAHQGWAYQGGYDSDGYGYDSDDGCEAGMCNDGSCCFCCDDCHGV